MQTAVPNLRRLLAHAWLGLLLVCGQSHATLHWLSHAVEASHLEAKAAPTPPHCGECDSLAAFGAALPTSEVPSLAPSDFEHVECGMATQPAPDIAFATGYLSRAPPTLS